MSYVCLVSYSGLVSGTRAADALSWGIAMGIAMGFWVVFLCGVLHQLRKRHRAAIEEAAKLAAQLAGREQKIKSLTREFEVLKSKLNHDLRGPLQTVMGFCELLSEERVGPLNRKQKEFVENVRSGTQDIWCVIRVVQNLNIESPHQVQSHDHAKPG